ncbi:hypothetical protein F5141DRAFT_1221069 [Pisolithus sp. B1]|nr:hypothetical protein F5141DRAFT_1221069 [Pisolithus sp. B1]
MTAFQGLTLGNVKSLSRHVPAPPYLHLPPFFCSSPTPSLLMSPPSKENFSSFSPCNELEVANLMDADDDVLDGKKRVPDAMMHTFRAGDEAIVQGEKGTMWHGVIEEIRIQHLKTIYKAWVAVRWYYGKWDIANKSIQNDVAECELVLSDHIDIISPQHIISPVDVMKFKEGEVYGPLIASDDVFTRWSMKTMGNEALEVCWIE